MKALRENICCMRLLNVQYEALHADFARNPGDEHVVDINTVRRLLFLEEN